MSQTQVTVPDLGGIDEVEVIEISVKVGDLIDAEQEIIVLESDKATMEVPAPIAGKVTEILISVGDKVSAGTPVVIVEGEGEATASSEEVKATDVVAEPQETQEQAPSVSPKNNESKKSEVEIIVPDLGGAGAVEVIELTVNVGDSIEAEESILVLESDKATMEVPAPQAGVVLSFTVSVGDKVSEGDVIGRMQVENSTGSADESEKAASPEMPTTILPSPAKSVAPTPPKSISNTVSTNKVHAGPAVRLLAREFGVNLSEVAGTGPKNRIIKEDVQAFVKKRISQPAVQMAAQAAGVVGSSEDFSRFGAIENVALNKIKQVTAKNMVQSWSTIPQVTQFDEADITDLEAYRKGTMAGMLPEGVKVSPLAFVLKACVLALQKFPQFNSSLNADGTELIMKQYYNVGVAVETPDGLLVPVIKQADKMGIVDLAVASSELAGKARNKKLPMDGMMGGSFTVSSLGGIGGTAFTPIVSAPQVAILGVSKASFKPVWNGSEFVPRLMLPLSLSYDHRVIDGAEAARFARYLCHLLGDTRHMLL